MEYMVDIPDVAVAFGLTILAGLATGIGSAIAFFFKRPKLVYLSFSLGLSTGVMVYVSFVELLPHAFADLGKAWGIVTFFAGMTVIGVIDYILPDIENPHHSKKIEDLEMVGPEGKNRVEHRRRRRSALKRTGLITAIAIAVHNFPEGLAVFGTALHDLTTGAIIALAIMIHNIPEGISISVPIFYATGDRKKAFKISFLSGLSEPLGALIGFAILAPFLSAAVLSGLLGFVAGIMVYISVDELLPTAHSYGHGHATVLGIALGMLIMALSLLVL